MAAVTTSTETIAADPPRERPGSRREARVRAEHAHRYPGLLAGQWEPAATVADRVLATRVLRVREPLHPGRIRTAARFEVRGGEGRDACAPGRPRREDR